MMRLIKLRRRKQGYMMISKMSYLCYLMDFISSGCLKNYSVFSLVRFNDIPGSERKILPQYDDPVADEVSLVT